MALADALDNVRNWADALSDRERRLLSSMAVVFVAIVVVLPMYVAISTISDIETDNAEIAQVLGIAEAAARKRHSRALTELREAVERANRIEYKSQES